MSKKQKLVIALSIAWLHNGLHAMKLATKDDEHEWEKIEHNTEQLINDLMNVRKEHDGWDTLEEDEHSPESASSLISSTHATAASSSTASSILSSASSSSSPLPIVSVLVLLGDSPSSSNQPLSNSAMAESLLNQLTASNANVSSESESESSALISPATTNQSSSSSSEASTHTAPLIIRLSINDTPLASAPSNNNTSTSTENVDDNDEDADDQEIAFDPAIKKKKKKSKKKKKNIQNTEQNRQSEFERALDECIDAFQMKLSDLQFNITRALHALLE